MKSLKSSFSFFKTNDSIPLIIFIFIFLGIGTFFFIKKATEKQKQDAEDSRTNAVEVDIIKSQNKGAQKIASTQSLSNAGTGTGPNTLMSMDPLYAPSSSFNDEVKLFIKKPNENPEVYSHTPLYIPPFGSGKETRCMGRHVDNPVPTTHVQSSLTSELVKTSSDASYLS